jgi:hypothetical protein
MLQPNIRLCATNVNNLQLCFCGLQHKNHYDMCNQQSYRFATKNEHSQLDAQGATNWHYMLQATNNECSNQQAQVAAKT